MLAETVGNFKLNSATALVYTFEFLMLAANKMFMGIFVIELVVAVLKITLKLQILENVSNVSVHFAICFIE